MRTTKPLLALAMASTFALAACGAEDVSEATDSASSAVDEATEEMTDEEMTDEETTEEMTSEEEMETSEDMAEETTEEMTSEDEMEMTSEGAMGDPAANLVGAGCADYAAAVPDGAGSVAGMAQDPVAVAASNNPLLTTLVAAVSGGVNENVNLVDTLNGDEFTVFAPVDDAFAALDAETMEALVTDDGTLLSTVLTYHVVPGQLSPEEVVGEQTTVQGGTVEVTGEGDMLMVNDANVICGGVMTENATVYLIDAVLMPQM